MMMSEVCFEVIQKKKAGTENRWVKMSKVLIIVEIV